MGVRRAWEYMGEVEESDDRRRGQTAHPKIASRCRRRRGGGFLGGQRPSPTKSTRHRLHLDGGLLFCLCRLRRCRSTVDLSLQRGHALSQRRLLGVVHFRGGRRSGRGGGGGRGGGRAMPAEGDLFGILRCPQGLGAVCDGAAARRFRVLNADQKLLVIEDLDVLLRKDQGRGCWRGNSGP